MPAPFTPRVGRRTVDVKRISDDGKGRIANQGLRRKEWMKTSESDEEFHGGYGNGRGGRGLSILSEKFQQPFPRRGDAFVDRHRLGHGAEGADQALAGGGVGADLAHRQDHELDAEEDAAGIR